MSMTRWITVLIVGVGACAGNKPETVVPSADLFGTWQLDRAASDSVRSDPDSGSDNRARPGGKGGRDGRGGPGGIGGSRIPRPGGRPEVLGAGLEETAELRRLLEAWTRSSERLAIAGAGGVISVEYEDGAKLQIVANGKKLKHVFRGHDEVESKAKWQDGRLEIEHKIGHVRIIEKYSRAPESPRLVVTTTVKGRLPRPMEFRRTYNLE